MSKIAQSMAILETAKNEFRALPLQKNGRPNRVKSDKVFNAAQAKLVAAGVDRATARNMVATAFEVAIGKPSFDRLIMQK